MKKFVFPIPKRIRWELYTYENVDIHRKHDCIFYDLCLNHAACFVWRAFSCKDCYHYYPDIYYYDKLREEIFGAMEFVEYIRKDNGNDENQS